MIWFHNKNQIWSQSKKNKEFIMLYRSFFSLFSSTAISYICYIILNILLQIFQIDLFFFFFSLPLYSQQINTGQIKAFCKCSADECTGVMGHEGLIRWGGEVTANHKKRGI